MNIIDELRMEPEHKLREMLEELYRDYQMRAAPIIKALVDIEATKPPPPLIVQVDDATAARMHEHFAADNNIRQAVAEIGKAMS